MISETLDRCRGSEPVVGLRASLWRWPVKTALLLSLFVGLSLAHGQGTIRFTNLGLDAPVRNATGELVPAATLPAATYYVAQLFAGSDPGTLAPVGAAETFSSPGVFGETESIVVLAGMAPGSHPWIQVRCWHEVSGIVIYPPRYTWLEIGDSAIFQLDTAGPGLGETAEDAPVLLGMTPFQLDQTFTLSVRVEGSDVVVRWDEITWGSYSPPPLSLERATSLSGTWKVLTNAVSPYLEPVGEKGSAYFRIAVFVP
jgi:hypothetical protein